MSQKTKREMCLLEVSLGKKNQYNQGFRKVREAQPNH